MMANPRPGQPCQIWYGPKYRGIAPHHGERGTVAVVSRRRPRNHGVRLPDGTLVVVPCGNLREPAAGKPAAESQAQARLF